MEKVESRFKGFTLIESVIVIIIMGLAMITITNFLVPQISRSANPHYQTRAAALGQSVMTQILARGFDHNSDFTGGVRRCGEVIAGQATVSCTAQADFGAEEDVGVEPEAIRPDLYNDVDDFIGCWEPQAANGCRDLNLLLADNSYRNFRLDISVSYANGTSLKRIRLTISATNQSPVNLSAYRGNY
ncbi:type IV pilus modification PilV family protein [Vibrio sp. TRT 29B02]|uniref:type IV pilus modification PilV family protein n=1 Tax=unclassified Vibrio TaxID=2614977 RepID=UPI003CF13CC4